MENLNQYIKEALVNHKVKSKYSSETYKVYYEPHAKISKKLYVLVKSKKELYDLLDQYKRINQIIADKLINATNRYFFNTGCNFDKNCILFAFDKQTYGLTWTFFDLPFEEGRYKYIGDITLTEFNGEDIFDKFGDLIKESLVNHKIKNYIDMVDLGLPSGTLWSRKNFGANNEYEPGEYYAWGELKKKESYAIENYDLFDINTAEYKKYSKEDKIQELKPEDDIITQTYGNKYKIPNQKDFEELIGNTIESPLYENNDDRGNIIGAKFTSKINGETIYFPFTGRKRDEKIIGLDRNGIYMCTNLDNDCLSENDYGREVMLEISKSGAEFWYVRRWMGIQIKFIEQI